MAVNVEIKRKIEQANPLAENGLTLVILTSVKLKGALDKPRIFTSIADLYDIFENSDGAEYIGKGNYQLLNAEYLLSKGVPIIPFKVGTYDTVKTEDIAAIKSLFEDYEFKQVVAPYEYLKSENSVNILKLAELSDELNIQLFLDVDPLEDNMASAIGVLNTVDLENNIAPVDRKHRIDINLNGGLPLFKPVKASELPEFGAGIEKTENVEENLKYYGVLAGTVKAAMKAQLLMSATPWLPVAGQANGAVSDIGKLFRNFTKKEKKQIQEKHINILMYKPGFGNLFVSQNTALINTNSKSDPLMRSHVVTEAIWLSYVVEKIAEKFEHGLNVSSTRRQLETELRGMLDKIHKGNGFEEKALLSVEVDKLEKTKINVNIAYIPVRAIEQINITLYLTDEGITAGLTDEEGGNL